MPRRTLWQPELGIWIELVDGRWAVSGSMPRVYVEELDSDGNLLSDVDDDEPTAPTTVSVLDLLGLISYHVNGFERCFKPDTGEPTNHGAPMGQYVVDCLTERFDPTLPRTDIEQLVLQDVYSAINQLNQVVSVLQSGEAISQRRTRRAVCMLGYSRSRITERCDGCQHFPGNAEARGWDVCELPWGLDSDPMEIQL